MTDPDPSSVAPALIGRGHVVQTIANALDAADASHGSALVIEGVAGVGKTAVLDDAVRRAEVAGFEVRSAVGVPVESELPFGTLRTLLARELRDGVLGDDTPALQGALDDDPAAAPPSVASVGTDLLDLLSGRGRTAPILVVVDDVQWCDESSIAVLGHMARRTADDRIVVLFGSRSGRAGAAPDIGGHHHLAGIVRVDLDPLDHDATIAALRARGCSAADADRWAPRCGGLPLAIAEVASHVAAGTVDTTTIGDLVPEIYRRQIEALPAEVKAAALRAALCADLAVLASLTPDPTRALAHAEEAGIVSIVVADHGGRHVRFRHPLLRAAVLAATSTDEERSAHRSIADALVANGDDDRAALHWGFAAGGLDDDAADAIADLAERARRRGALVEAARGFERAATLTTRSATRAPMLTRAADCWFDSGRSDPAFRTIEEAIRVATDPRDRADARALRANMSRWTRSPRWTVTELVAIHDDMRIVDPHRAAVALISAAGAGYLGSDVATGAAQARSAEQIALELGDVLLAASAGASVAWNAFLLTEWSEAEDRLAPLEPIMRELLLQQSWAGIHLAEVFAVTWVCAERWDVAEPLVRTILHTTRVMGAKLSVASTSLLLASLCWRRGRWDEAGALSFPLLDDDDLPPVTRCYIEVLVAQLAASMGSVETTRSLVEQAMPVALDADVPLIVATGYAALGHLELSLGNHDTALAHLDRVAELLERIEFHEPEHLLWHGDHLDALIAAGRVEEASERAGRLAKLAHDGDRRWLKGIVARTRARLCVDDAEAHQLYEDAIAFHDDLGMPFEVARTLLVRDGPGDRADARRLFLRLGARAWADAATPAEATGTEAAASGAPPRLLDVLSPSERDVAIALVSGRTNREIAAELHLSVKTIDHYLQRSYRKLGVKNRTALAGLVTQALAAPQRSDR